MRKIARYICILGAAAFVLLSQCAAHTPLGFAENLSSTTLLAEGGKAFVTGDFNGDGKPDFAVADVDNNLRVLLGTGNGRFTAVSTLAAAANGSSPLVVVAADLNGDGKLDLATAALPLMLPLVA